MKNFVKRTPFFQPARALGSAFSFFFELVVKWKHFDFSEKKDLKKKVIKKVVKKRKKKTLWNDYQVPIGCEFKMKESYQIFISEDGRNGNCEILGVDIGYVHLAIVGIVQTKPGTFVTSHLCLISLAKLKKGIHYCLDQMIDLFHDNPDFDWVRKARKVRIELQLQTNPGARCISFGLRSFFRTWQLNKKWTTQTDFVHALNKYKVPLKFCQHCEKNPLRVKKIKGPEGKKNRKQLAIEDFQCWLKRNNINSTLNFFDYGISTGDQMHDYADAFFIAMYPEFFKMKK